MEISSIWVWLVPIFIISIGLFIIIRSFIRSSDDKNLTDEINYDADKLVIPRDQRDDFLAHKQQVVSLTDTAETSTAEPEDVINAIDVVNDNDSNINGNETEAMPDNETEIDGLINTDIGSELDAIIPQSSKSEIKTNTDTHSDISENEYVSKLGDTLSSLENATADIMPVLDEKGEEEAFSGKSDLLDSHLSQQDQADQNCPLRNPSEIITLMLMPNDIVNFNGQTVLDVLHSYGLKFGEMNLFHRYEETDGSGVLWFSVMRYHAADGNSVPFDLQTLGDENIDGLTFFLPLPHPNANAGIGAMLSMSASIASDLNGTVYTEEFQKLERTDRDHLKNYVVNFH